MHHGQRPPTRLARAAALALGVALAATAMPAGAADVVYTWRDSGGQLVITSVPPPWLRDPGTASRGPRVNVFKDGKFVPPERVGPGGRVIEAPAPKPGAAPPAAAKDKLPALPELLARRDAALGKLVGEALRVGPAAGNQAFFATLDRYLELCTQADAVDPVGAAARKTERSRSMQRVKANIERVLRQPPQRAAFQNDATAWFSDKSDLSTRKIVRCLRDGLC